MSFEEIQELLQNPLELPYLDLTSTRDEMLKEIKKNPQFDVVVVGGGIHGATFAHTSALNGLRTLLLEKNDYAFEASSRSSKMAHGGLRYLAYGDFGQVREGVRAREDLFKTAPHLVKPANFILPVKSQLKRIINWVGLQIYSLFIGFNKTSIKWIGVRELGETINGIDRSYIGAYGYRDGLLNDSRFASERILSARQEGAICLNYANVELITKRGSEPSFVKFKELLSEERIDVEAGIVINCSGQWTDRVGVARQNPPERIRRSRGAHIIFDVPWKSSPLLLPLEKFGAVYFVWPYLGGTLVGTTEMESHEAEADPIPLKSELDEILRRIAVDLPGSNLSKDKIRSVFAGIRSLPDTSSRSVRALSRKASWEYRSGVLTLLGGKYTTAVSTVDDGVQEVFSLSAKKERRVSVQDRPLPGSWRYAETLNELDVTREKLGAPKGLFDIAGERYGGLLRYCLKDDSDWQVVGGIIFRGEIRFAVQSEQALTFDDLCRRRLNLIDRYGHKHPGLLDMRDVFEEIRVDQTATKFEQFDEYVQRIDSVLATL